MTFEETKNGIAEQFENAAREMRLCKTELDIINVINKWSKGIEDWCSIHVDDLRKLSNME